MGGPWLRNEAAKYWFWPLNNVSFTRGAVSLCAVGFERTCVTHSWRWLSVLLGSTASGSCTWSASTAMSRATGAKGWRWCRTSPTKIQTTATGSSRKNASISTGKCNEAVSLGAGSNQNLQGISFHVLYPRLSFPVLLFYHHVDTFSWQLELRAVTSVPLILFCHLLFPSAKWNWYPPASQRCFKWFVNFNRKAWESVLVVWEEACAGWAEHKGLCAGREYGGRRNNLEEETMESGSEWIQIMYLVLSPC